MICEKEESAEQRCLKFPAFPYICTLPLDGTNACIPISNPLMYVKNK